MLVLLIVALCSTLIYRVFGLQIVNGEEYLNNFQLKIKKERSISSTRGNIYDRNGNLLAYNELSFSVTIEDVYESGKNKNANLNATIYEVIKILEANNDSILNDFNIYLNEDDRFTFGVSGNALLRFLADVYGHSSINDLKYAEKTATPDDVIKYLCSNSRYGIGNYETIDGKSTFVPLKGYTNEEALQILTIRYAMSKNSYQKYIATQIASDVSDKSVAIIMENTDRLLGVTILEDTVRRYVDSTYFSAILGYTGKISSEELEKYQALDATYSTSDMVGKTGIEQYMEIELQGSKGSETVFVDNLGKVIESTNLVEPVAGNDIYLTIDKDLQIATYNILEQQIAGILVSKIDNIKEYIPAENASQSKIRIAIYDVYYALFENNIIKLKDLANEDASDISHEVFNAFLERREDVFEQLRNELFEKKTIYSKLKEEFKIYESYIVNMLSSNDVGIIQTDKIDTSDPMYISWRQDEDISLYDYLIYAIQNGWVDVTKLDMDTQYMDTNEIYSELVDLIIELLSDNSDFSKRIIKYMIKSDKITGKQICTIMCNEHIVNVEDEVCESLTSGKLSPYQFMIDRISNLEITPAQLALDPCSGSIVITDVDTGDVLAMVTYPSYDNNKLANSIDPEYYNQLLNDLSNPMWNYATQHTTAPGSTFKMVTAAAALEEEVVKNKEKVICTGTYDKLSPTIYRCWIYPGAHNAINVTTAIAKSCNSFFYEMGYRLSTVGSAYDSDLGLKTMENYADMFGLTDKSGVEISESSPNVSDKYSVVSAIGQGTHDYSTVGLARYVTTIANSGTCYNLTLLDSLRDSDGNVLKEYNAEIRNVIDFKESTWKVLHEGMLQVVQGKSYFKDVTINVAGKTGTAQESTARPTHALFVCYAPYESPEIAIATRIAFGYSSDYAAETTKDVIMYYFNLEAKDIIINGQAGEMESSGVNTD